MSTQFLEVDSAGRDGWHNDPQHYVLLGEVYAGKTGTIADTLNCDCAIEPSEQRKWLERLAHRHNVHERLLTSLKDLIAEIDCFEEIPAGISAATLTIARQAIAARRGRLMTDITLTFDNKGDFAAHAAAVSYLRGNRFSVGPMQGNDPIAIMYGVNICIGKWRSISQMFRETVDGTIEAADMRHGPVTVTIRARASAAARAAVSTKAA